MVSILLPKPGPRLGGRTRLAYLLMPAFRRGQKAGAAFWPMQYLDGKPFVSERFVEEPMALAWLQVDAGAPPRA